MKSKDFNSVRQPLKNHIPKSVIKTSRDEGCWNLQIRRQENYYGQDKLIPFSKLPLSELPRGLYGYAFIVGALFQSEDRPQEDGTQLYTGDGMIYRIGFEGGKAILKTRIAKTPCYYADPATQFYLANNSIEPLLFAFRKNRLVSYFTKKYKLFSYFSAFRNGGPSRFSLILGSRNQLNTAFVRTRDHLLLTIDAGRPYLLDPNTMELLEPAGSTQEWFSIFPVISRLTWINIFETYVNSAHYVADVSRLEDKQDEVFSTNYSTGYNGKFKKIVNWVLDSIWLRKIIKFFYALRKQKFELKRELGRFTYLIRYRFEDKRNKFQSTMERWRLILPDGQPVLVEQSLHQLAITDKYIILADISFRMEFSQIFSPFIFGFLRLWKFNKIYSLGSWIHSVFLRQVKPLPFANLYIVKREDLDNDTQNKSEDIPENIPEITVGTVRLPHEISHFSADYANPDNKITLHVGHVNGWDVTEWITQYDKPVSGKPAFRRDLAGMMVGSTDLGSLGRYVVDGTTGQLESCRLAHDSDSTWSLSVYTHRDLNRDLSTESAHEVKNIYWLSLGFTWELIPQRIYDAYKSSQYRTVPIEELPDHDKPITLLRLDTEKMAIVDSYQFPSGCYVSSPQFIPSNFPCPDDMDKSIHGYIVCTVLLDSDGASESNHPIDEFWVFHADDLTNKPVYRLGALSDADPLNLAITIHSTWLPDIACEQQYSAEERCKRRQKSVENDYQHLIIKKGKATQELFHDIVYPHFAKQTLESDFENFLSSKELQKNSQL